MQVTKRPDGDFNVTWTRRDRPLLLVAAAGGLAVLAGFAASALGAHGWPAAIRLAGEAAAGVPTLMLLWKAHRAAPPPAGDGSDQHGA